MRSRWSRPARSCTTSSGTTTRKANPRALDPKNWVGDGQRTIDEMGFFWIGWVELTEEEYKQQLEERKAARQRDHRVAAAAASVARRPAAGACSPRRPAAPAVSCHAACPLARKSAWRSIFEAAAAAARRRGDVRQRCARPVRPAGGVHQQLQVQPRPGHPAGLRRLVAGRRRQRQHAFRLLEPQLRGAAGDSGWARTTGSSRAGPIAGSPRSSTRARNRNLFTVNVPKTFGAKEELVWTVTFNGQTERAIGWRQAEWEIDPAGGASGGGNTDPERVANKPPALTIEPPAAVRLPTAAALVAVITDDGLPKPRPRAKPAVGQETPPTLQGGTDAPVNVPQVALRLPAAAEPGRRHRSSPRNGRDVDRVARPGRSRVRAALRPAKDGQGADQRHIQHARRVCAPGRALTTARRRHYTHRRRSRCPEERRRPAVAEPAGSLEWSAPTARLIRTKRARPGASFESIETQQE